MHRFHDVRYVITRTGFLRRDLEVDILAETISSFANRYGPRLDAETWDKMIRNFETVCEVIDERALTEELSLQERIERCVEWFEDSLKSTLGEPRKKTSDRRRTPERRWSDRRVHHVAEYDGPERRRADRRNTGERRASEDRRSETSDLL
jgi:hypothetical protein